MIPKPFKPFVNDLLEATDEGALQWTEGNVAAYYCARGNLTVHLSQHADHDEERSCIRLSFAAGARMTPFVVTEGEPDYRMMEALYTSVVASANHVTDDLKRFFKM